MRKILVIPDSFKGTITSVQACEIIKKAIYDVLPETTVLDIPIADGGEGTVDCFLNFLEAKKITINTTGPYFGGLQASYALKDDLAIIEMSSTAGITLTAEKNPMISTTYGLGTLVLDAIKRGAKKILIGLGGSVTNDGGAGFLAALGATFLNRNNTTFTPTGGTLSEINQINLETLSPLLKDIEIIGMCDVDAPLYGKKGAAYVFGPQKGASLDNIEVLDQGLRHYALKFEEILGHDDASAAGAGAAGGLGFSIIGPLKGTLKSGIDLILEYAHFDEKLHDADLVITGEGKIDSQSLGGKVISGIAKKAKQKNVPVLVLCGSIGDITDEIYDLGVSAIFSINRQPLAFEDAKNKSFENLFLVTKDTIKLIKEMNYKK